MKRTTKALIALSVFAVFNGLTMPPRDAHADKWVIDGDAAFEALKNDKVWVITDKGNAINPNKYSSGNTVIFKDITSEISLRAAYSTTSNVNNNTLVIIDSSVDTSNVADKGNGGDHIIGGYAGAGDTANNNKVILVNSTVKAPIYGGDSYGGDACGNLVVIDGTTI